MTESQVRIVLALALVGVLGVAATAGAMAVPSFTKRDVAVDSMIATNQAHPETDGRWVVYVKFTPFLVPPSDDQDLFSFDCETGITTLIDTTSGNDETNPDVAADLVAYQTDELGDNDICLYDLRTGSVVGYPGMGADEQTEPRISSRFVVWRNITDDTLHYHDLRTNGGGAVPDSASVDGFDIDGDRLVFAVDGAANPDEVYVWRPGRPAGPEQIYSAPAALPDITSVRVHGERAVLTATSPTDADAISIETRTHVPLGPSSSTVKRNAINIFHKSEVWEACDTWPQTTDVDLHFYYNDYLSTTAVTSDDAPNQTEPAIFGNRVVYKTSDSLGDIVMSFDEPSIERTAGSDRYATAVAISQAYYPDGTTSNPYTVFLCTGTAFPDALATTPLATMLDAPLLLVKPDSVPAAVMTELERLDPSQIFIVGGTAAISQGVENALGTAGYTVDRIGGSDRYATSVMLADELGDTAGDLGIDWDGTVFVTRGDDFPDALAAGPAAASIGAPILLTKPGSLPVVIHDAIDWPGVQGAIVIGGTSAVSVAVQSQIDALLDGNGGAASDRWFGQDRYATSAVIASESWDRRWLDADMIGIATGLNFPDALGGGAACAHYGSPLLLTKPGALSPPVDSLLLDHQYEIGRADIFGGDDVVSEAVRTTLATRLK